MVAGREVEGRLAQLDGQSVPEHDEQERQLQQHGLGPGIDVGELEAAGFEIKPHHHQHQQRLVGKDLQQLAVRPDLAVGRRGRKRAHHQKDGPHGLDEEDQQQVGLQEKEHQGDGGGRDVAVGAEGLPDVDHQRLLAEQFHHVVERLQHRRPDARLHAGGQNTVHPADEPPDDGSGDQAAEDQDGGPRHSAPPRIKVSRIPPPRLTQSVSRASPKMVSR